MSVLLEFSGLCSYSAMVLLVIIIIRFWGQWWGGLLVTGVKPTFTYASFCLLPCDHYFHHIHMIKQARGKNTCAFCLLLFLYFRFSHFDYTSSSSIAVSIFFSFLDIRLKKAGLCCYPGLADGCGERKWSPQSTFNRPC
ncbi:hypothetical protein BDV39DRAFT_173608 [Aspergillus sergii]|uniref:Uncharacterized protein n=1 Tax=Aspergillus sergii TaxID=1034303 RepID=A0A5N6X950_9EURO|nr:hypothetical protein BDV39DRAFT_173608 [Aspergillus sergii]